MKIYDLEGNEHDKEPVDAAECIRLLGWTLQRPITPVSDNADSENAKTGSKKKSGSTGEQTSPVAE
jgi:hypothetical protein